MQQNEVNIPDIDEFMDKLYVLNPMGDPNNIYSFMLMRLGKVLPTKEVLTFDLLVKRYQDYLNYVRPYNDIKDKQYIKKEFVRKALLDYMITETYINDYSAALVNPNDAYLFGI